MLWQFSPLVTLLVCIKMAKCIVKLFHKLLAHCTNFVMSDIMETPVKITRKYTWNVKNTQYLTTV